MMLVLPMACLVLLGLALTFRVHPHLFWGIVASLAVGGAAFALNLAKISAEAHSGPGILGLVDPRVSGLAFLFGSFAAVAYSLFGILMRAFAQLRWPPVVFHVLAPGLAGVMVASFLGVALQVQEFAHFQKRRRHPHYATSTAGVNREP